VRGILNGTTNYILTKMFSYGESFEDSLKDAQEKGYAERNPDADVLGLDAARKISILGALATENLVNTEKIHVEGITEIRSQDVKAAEKAGMSIKLLGRAIFDGMKITMMVAPFMLSRELPLSCVNGVYNAVEVIGEPIGNLMFYGQGAGAGATASAIVSDLIQTISHGMSALQPSFVKNDSFLTDFGDFECRHYVSAEGIDEEKLSEIFGEIQVICNEGEIAFITEAMKEKDVNEKIALSGAKITSRIRLL
jgi:homoserine dehydrogenase